MSHMVIIGAGAWGCAFARVAALAGSDVRLVCHTPEQAERLAATRRDEVHLGAMELPEQVAVTHSADPAWLDGADVVVIALPSRAVGDEAPRVAAALPAGAGVVSLTKGLEPGTGRVRHEFEVAMVDGQLSGDVRLLVTDRQAIVKNAVGSLTASGTPEPLIVPIPAN